MNQSKSVVNQMVTAALLCAIGIVIPMVMPKLILGPMSITPGSHIAIFIAMFISPATAAVVCIGTTVGFFITTTPIIALRAASHIIFALIGSFYLKHHPKTLDRPVNNIIFNFLIAIIHAVGEVAVVTPLFLSGSSFTTDQLSNGFFMSVILLVGGVTILHSMLDYTISIIIRRPIQLATGRK